MRRSIAILKKNEGKAMSRQVYIGKLRSEHFDHDKFTGEGIPEMICKEQPHFVLFGDIVVDAFINRIPNSSIVDPDCCVIKMNKAEMIKYLSKEKYRQRPECFPYMEKALYERHASEEMDHLLSAADALSDDEEYLLVACDIISSEEWDAEEYVMPEETAKAMRIAAEAHKGQKDWYGGRYIVHPLTVSAYCVTERGAVAALLHDVVEDTNVTLDDLRAEGISEDVVIAVDCLTERKDEEITDYLKRVATNDIAVEVKFADMRDNSDKNRFPQGDEEKAERTFRKYTERAKELFLLVGEERAKRLMDHKIYEYFTAGFDAIRTNSL
jgi:hypothetical protein